MLLVHRNGRSVMHSFLKQEFRINRVATKDCSFVEFDVLDASSFFTRHNLNFIATLSNEINLCVGDWCFMNCLHVFDKLVIDKVPQNDATTGVGS